jgi:hypothetical protein
MSARYETNDLNTDTGEVGGSTPPGPTTKSRGKVIGMRKPLARVDEPYSSVNETRIEPWVFYVLERAA